MLVVLGLLLPASASASATPAPAPALSLVLGLLLGVVLTVVLLDHRNVAVVVLLSLEMLELMLFASLPSPSCATLVASTPAAILPGAAAPLYVFFWEMGRWLWCRCRAVLLTL
ncbi:MAG: hypothetical protein COB29_14365 [Sulfitobacter sp.]|nr:MAG: hypothetical protein COB29_14365 [Sulfitobacter sp.]